MVSGYFGVNKNISRQPCFLQWVLWLRYQKTGDVPAQSVGVGMERESTVMAGAD
jgi:hypothetical protein